MNPLRRHTAALAALTLTSTLSGCVVGDFTADPDPSPTPGPEPGGIVREPRHGDVLVGDPSTLTITVRGQHPQPGAGVAIQVLADPNNLATWTTLASTQARGDGAFSVEVRPVAAAADAVRWPAGGILRMRVVDASGRALPHDSSQPERTVLAVVNESSPPANWQYLIEKPLGNAAQTQAYYQAINAPITLDAFRQRFGFVGNDPDTVYYNEGDLGIGREMHCRPQAGGGLACYVRNFGEFGGDRDEAIALTLAGGIPLATVAMTYQPPVTAANAVRFMVYGPNGALINEAQLDTHGDNTSIPQNCLNCHGANARYDAATRQVLDARFLPFDPAAFSFASRTDVTFAAQEGDFARLNSLIAATSPTPQLSEWMAGMFPASGRYQPGFVPPAWSQSAADRQLYGKVIAPYCRTCHASLLGGDLLASPAVLQANAAMVAAKVCNRSPRAMPSAEVTARSFFASGARAWLLTWLDQPGSCAP